MWNYKFFNNVISSSEPIECIDDLYEFAKEKFESLDQQMCIQNLMLQSILDNLKKQNFNFDIQASDETFELPLPVKTKDDLYKFESLLNDNIKKRIVLKKLSLYGGNNAKILTSRVIDSLMTTNLLSQICWKGAIEKPGMALEFKNVLDIIAISVKTKYNNEDVGLIVEVCLKNKFRNSNTKIKKAILGSGSGQTPSIGKNTSVNCRIWKRSNNTKRK